MSVIVMRSRYPVQVYLRYVLVLLLVLVSLHSIAGNKKHKAKKPVTQIMTVAAIRAANPKETFVRVTFSRSQRFYKLPNDADPKYMELLKESEKNGTPVVVKRASERSDVIIAVEKK